MVEEDCSCHPIDCPICDKAGECRLQDYHFQYGQARAGRAASFTSRRRHWRRVTLFVDAACSAAVACGSREISGSAS